MKTKTKKAPENTINTDDKKKKCIDDFVKCIDFVFTQRALNR